jgi:hypothetical protein
MSDIVNALRKLYAKHPVCQQAADRIEALEAALQRIVEISEHYVVMPSVLCEAIQDARAALDKDVGK